MASDQNPYVTASRAIMESFKLRPAAGAVSAAPAPTSITDGPWQSQHDFDMDGEATIIGAIDGPDDGQFHYTVVCELNTDAPEWRANKRLILAAEAMLKALTALDECILGKAESNASGNPEWEYVSARVNAARAAIRNATARPLRALAKEG